jgi:hypothetical protein
MLPAEKRSHPEKSRNKRITASSLMRLMPFDSARYLTTDFTDTTDDFSKSQRDG